MKSNQELRDLVKDKYSSIAKSQAEDCCGDSSCLEYSFIGDDYQGKEGYDARADLGLGCGVPTEHAKINPGDTVVDLGSGAGNDAFVARAEAGSDGRVIGIDFSEEMVQRARNNVKRLGYDNIEFRHGDIEDIPLADEATDVVISNCVFNLVPDKESAFRETFRILKPGGHFSISDVVVEGNIPVELKEQAELYAGCVSGAIDLEKYLGVIQNAGFEEVSIVKKRQISLPESLVDSLLDEEQKKVYEESEFGIFSITVFGQRPKTEECCTGPCC